MFHDILVVLVAKKRTLLYIIIMYIFKLCSYISYTILQLTYNDIRDTIRILSTIKRGLA